MPKSSQPCTSVPRAAARTGDWDARGRMVPCVGIDEPDGVDARRAAVGLPPLRWERPASPDEPPPSPERLATRAAEAEAWAIRVGWR